MEQTEAIGAAVDLAEAAISARVARVHAGGEARGRGFPSTTSWLRARLGCTHTRARERLALARQRGRLTETVKRLTCGELSFGYAAAIAGGLHRVDDDNVAECEQILLAMTETGRSVAEVTRVARHAADLNADQAGHDTRPRADRRGTRRSWLEISPDFDRRGAYLHGWLSNTQASLLTQALQHLAKPAGATDMRTHPERLADALHTLLSGGGQRWNATFIVHHPPPPPQHPKPSHDSGTDHDPGHEEQGRRRETLAERLTAMDTLTITCARTADGYPLTPTQARTLATNAGISTLLLGPGSLPLYLGRKVRLATTAQRKTLTALYHSCAVDHCDIPTHLCEIDHVTEWAKGGESNITNFAPLCSFHNQYRNQHPDRIHITHHPNGQWRYQLS